MRSGVFEQQHWETKYPGAAAIVGQQTDPNAVIFSGLHSGSLRYYAGRTTLTYFNLDPGWIERAVAWLGAHEAHPYALLEEFEVKDFRARFASGGSLGRLEMRPSIVYDGPTKIYLFDLMRPPGSANMETVTDRFPAVVCLAPVAPPTLVIK